ncbi:MAG: FAD-dependent oxidoreductase [Treponema sp.]|jgi:thioredoxin reductase (NADPH)|nr:FAD-dependent oxidoreductase [Treponema sp.]
MDATDWELIIIGAGPAGLTAAQYGARAALRTLVIEQLSPGGQALLIDKLENYPGLFPAKSGYDFSQDLYCQAGAFGAQFLFDSVLALEKEADRFLVTPSGGQKMRAKAVIIAAGTKRRPLGIPGEAEFAGRGVSSCATCDGPFFKNNKIFVVGGGDAACVEAQYLSHLSSQVVLIHRRNRFRAQGALAEQAARNPHIEVRLNTRMREIRGDTQVRSAVLERLDSGELYEEAAGAVFIFAGTLPQTAFLTAEPGTPGRRLAVAFDPHGYIVTGGAMETAVPGLFAAGDVRAGSFRQAVTAAGEGAAAAHSAALYIDGLDGGADR